MRTNLTIKRILAFAMACALMFGGLQALADDVDGGFEELAVNSHNVPFYGSARTRAVGSPYDVRILPNSSKKMPEI